MKIGESLLGFTVGVYTAIAVAGLILVIIEMWGDRDWVIVLMLTLVAATITGAVLASFNI